MAHVLVAAARMVRHQDGQDLLEYGILMALIAIIAMASVRTVGTVITTVFWQTIAASI
jgi:Flp pilus assembly pilin Flp